VPSRPCRELPQIAYRTLPSALGPSDETDACFIVRDANGQTLAYMCFEEEPGV
jgi:hypothetical protein